MSESFRETSTEASSSHPFPSPSSFTKAPLLFLWCFSFPGILLYGVYMPKITCIWNVDKSHIRPLCAQRPTYCEDWRSTTQMFTLCYFQFYQPSLGKRRPYSGDTDGTLKAEMDGDILETHRKKQRVGGVQAVGQR